MKKQDLPRRNRVPEPFGITIGNLIKIVLVVVCVVAGFRTFAQSNPERSDVLFLIDTDDDNKLDSIATDPKAIMCIDHMISDTLETMCPDIFFYPMARNTYQEGLMVRCGGKLYELKNMKIRYVSTDPSELMQLAAYRSEVKYPLDTCTRKGAVAEAGYQAELIEEPGKVLHLRITKPGLGTNYKSVEPVFVYQLANVRYTDPSSINGCIKVLLDDGYTVKAETNDPNNTTVMIHANKIVITTKYMKYPGG